MVGKLVRYVMDKRYNKRRGVYVNDEDSSCDVCDNVIKKKEEYIMINDCMEMCRDCMNENYKKEDK